MRIYIYTYATNPLYCQRLFYLFIEKVYSIQFTLLKIYWQSCF
jgi:hypothetical protein